MVVRDYSRAHNITVTEEELDDIINDYQKTDYYDEVLDTYTYSELRNGLRNYKLFQKAKRFIIENEIQATVITQKDIDEFSEENGLVNMKLTEKQHNDVVTALTENKQEAAYNEFVDLLVQSADIVYK